ncbi:RHS repeat domain-containing protein [Caenimonas soli]|uniref:RHS repeat domain-containing protein n=1 Tax=Caenimonas soli TaxID=2735555 RepID=UPI001557949B|nr:RHS repeat-associated core domain-containing protein [Caenimonas soli]NPC58148.1 RHS repeat-associated core domain-containing protein [Caenimonas soli]
MGQINYSLDAQGNVVERTIGSAGTTKSEYDGAGRLVKVTAPDGKQARYTYDQAGRVSMVERDLNAKAGQAQTLVTYNRYDSADRIVSVAEVKQAGAVETLLVGQAFTRGHGGTITKIETYRASSYDSAAGKFAGTPTKTQAFEYDNNARLTRETMARDGAITDAVYEYNAGGNRTKKTVTTAAGFEITTYTYDQADRLTQESVSLVPGGSRVTTYTWDVNGNLATKTEPGKVSLHRFDPQSRLIDIRVGATQAEAQAATSIVSYSYDASGNRVKKGGTQASSYVIDASYSPAQVALETKDGGRTAYVRGLQLIRQTRVNGTTAEDLFPLHGHMGTSLGAVDADGDATEQIDVDVFGNLDQVIGLKQEHLYTGEYWDQDARLLYLRARWYDPKIGRFISADPFEGKQGDSRSLNRYAYAHSDPVHNTDPTGRFSLGELNSSINIQLTVVRQSFLTGGKQAGGRALQRLGKLVEEGVEKLIRNCLKPGSGATLNAGKKMTTKRDGANAVIDFFVEMGGKVKNIEVKYQLPTGSSSGGFTRAAKQLQAMIDKGEEGLLIAFKELKTDARAKKLLDSVSGNAGTVQVVEGFLGLGAFLGEMIIEECIK